MAADADQIERDRDLVARLLAGDEDAFEGFFDQYFSGLYRFALSRLDGDETLAQEMAQATMVQAIDKLDTYRAEAALMSWLVSFCLNEIRAHFRREKRYAPEAELDEGRPEIRDGLGLLMTGLPDPDDAARTKDVEGLVHLALDELPPHYARALEWKYLEALPVVEIAMRLDLSAKATESLLTRARDAFRTGFAQLAKSFEKGFQGLRTAAPRRSRP